MAPLGSAASSNARRCNGCGDVKLLTDFHRDRRRADGSTFYCKACIYRYDEASRTRDPQKYAAIRRRAAYKHRLRTVFGLTVEQYETLLARQNGVCAICKGVETTTSKWTAAPRTMSVDHDHDTGVVRGLLCSACNSGLANFQDDPTRLASAIEYLARVSS